MNLKEKEIIVRNKFDNKVLLHKFKYEDVKEAVNKLLIQINKNEYADHEDLIFVKYKIKEIFGDFEE